MTALVWDQVGARTFETGVDRGVLYLADNSGVVWNGLRSVVETTSARTVTPLYHDSVKYSDTQVTGDFVGSISAFTYPDEFLEYEGTWSDEFGVLLTNQYLKRFGLSYKTRIGNDTEGTDYAYKLHLLYNLLAVPKDVTYATMSGTSGASDFGWTISGVPEAVPGMRPTAHLIIDSRRYPDGQLIEFEEILYGNEEQEPHLPSLSDVQLFFANWNGITITDHGDGTWSATGSDYYIEMLHATQFQLNEANAEYLDADTYEISTGTEE